MNSKHWPLGISWICLFSCASTPTLDEPREETPFVVVLGTAQDGGLPQIGCEEELCIRATRDPQRARLVASLLIVDPRSEKRWLIDATPDLPEQLRMADEVSPRPAGEGRPPLFDGIFLTHAHVGHYTGLAYLGREVYGARANRVLCSWRMADFLLSNGPWSLLAEAEHIAITVVSDGQWIELGQELRIRPFLVPHRDEFSDTFGFEVAGPNRRLIYIPDIDKWSVFENPIEEVVQEVDYALLDGSFFADGEIPGRAMSEIPHPFVVESLGRFGKLPRAEREKVYFTHLNHTNPASDPDSSARAQVRAAGSQVAWDGLRLGL